MVRQAHHDTCHPEHVEGSAKHGFTLIELTIVIFLMLLMLAIVSINFASRLSSNKLHAAAREISATLRHAKALTYLKGEQQAIEFDIEARQYGLAGQGGRQLPEDVTIMVTDPVQGELNRGKWQAVFFPEGGVSGGTVILTSKKAEVRLKIDPIVGSVVIGDDQHK